MTYQLDDGTMTLMTPSRALDINVLEELGIVLLLELTTKQADVAGLKAVADTAAGNDVLIHHVAEFSGEFEETEDLRGHLTCRSRSVRDKLGREGCCVVSRPGDRKAPECLLKKKTARIGFHQEIE